MQEGVTTYFSKPLLALVKANLIPQLIVTLNPQPLSFTEAVDIHVNIMNIVRHFVCLAKPGSLEELGIEDGNEQQAVHETVLKQVLAPSEKYIMHLCVNRNSIVDGDMSKEFMRLLAHLLRICAYYQPTMDFVFHMPVFLTIPSCIAFFEDDGSIWRFLVDIIKAQLGWNKKRGEERQIGKTMHRTLRMEGNEDVVEERLRNDKSGYFGSWIVPRSITWNSLLGMNLPEPW
ncbi:hypothetical protein BLNAU_9826 [Blattamonas nauphoetae]|uniref:Uncharacterized protein n=1 Tax=Blattamonas nauphoetae TaxID=2049346 RepID=A0ABQ9XUW6_9EUKA|nr:hypothetical protein BLNAU_9826 [Blattamonas nauphoetae]